MANTSALYVGFVIFQVFVVFSIIGLYVKPGWFDKVLSSVGDKIAGSPMTFIVLFVLAVAVISMSMLGRVSQHTY